MLPPPTGQGEPCRGPCRCYECGLALAQLWYLLCLVTTDTPGCHAGKQASNRRLQKLLDRKFDWIPDDA